MITSGRDKNFNPPDQFSRALEKRRHNPINKRWRLRIKKVFWQEAANETPLTPLAFMRYSGLAESNIHIRNAP